MTNLIKFSVPSNKLKGQFIIYYIKLVFDHGWSGLGGIGWCAWPLIEMRGDLG